MVIGYIALRLPPLLATLPLFQKHSTISHRDVRRPASNRITALPLLARSWAAREVEQPLNGYW